MIAAQMIDACTDALRLTPLLLTAIWSFLPKCRHHAWACSSGTTGHHALKEMLQNGTPGHTVLLESGDLRKVVLTATTTTEEDGCLYPPNHDLQFLRYFATPFDSHLTIYTNHEMLPDLGVTAITRLTSVDLSRMSNVKGIDNGFLQGNERLTTIDFTPLTNVMSLGKFFLRNCISLTSLNLNAFSQLTIVQEGFLSGCAGLKELDLSPLSNVVEVHGHFLEGCTGLTALDLRRWI